MRTSPAEATLSPAAARRRETFWNGPNTISVVRTAAVPVLMLFPFFSGPTGSRVVAWVFIVAAVSDVLDGWLARRHGTAADFGARFDMETDALLILLLSVLCLRYDKAGAWILIGRHETAMVKTGHGGTRKDRETYRLGPALAGYRTVRIWIRDLSVDGGTVVSVALTDRNVWFSGVVEVKTDRR